MNSLQQMDKDVLEKSEERLLKDMLEELANTPLMFKNEEGEIIDQTRSVLWAIRYVKQFAHKREIKL